jgi:hypothetical protein
MQVAWLLNWHCVVNIVCCECRLGSDRLYLRYISELCYIVYQCLLIVQLFSYVSIYCFCYGSAVNFNRWEREQQNQTLGNTVYFRLPSLHSHCCIVGLFRYDTFFKITPSSPPHGVFPDHQGKASTTPRQWQVMTLSPIVLNPFRRDFANRMRPAQYSKTQI